MTKKRMTLDSLLSGPSDNEPPAQRFVTSPVTSGALKAMTESLQRMSDGAAEADRLREALGRSERVVEIDVGLIDRSFVRDRFGDDGDSGIAELAASIVESGQQVPILLRPHPERAERFQIAYGHRRVEACRRLAVPVKAVVRQMSNAELVVAQGKENLDRRDLSFIERAWFARELEDGGFDRRTIMAALGVAKSDLSVLISIARELPEVLVKAIGSAPKVGRPRWQLLGAAWKAAPANLDSLFASEAFVRCSSEEKFGLVAAVLSKPRSEAVSELWISPDGEPIVQISRRKLAGTLMIDERAAPAFTDFILRNMPDLFDAYRREQERTS